MKKSKTREKRSTQKVKNAVSIEILRERELQFNKKCNIVRHSDTSKFIKTNKGENTFICDKIKEAHNYTI